MDSMLSSQWRMLSHPSKSKPPTRGLDRLSLHAEGIAKRLLCSSKYFLRLADSILAEERIYKHIPDNKMVNLMAPLRYRFLRGRDTDADRNQAFAILREVITRTVGLRPYREQVAGALALHAGCVVEMATGEGKTLMATMPAVLAGWRGRGCHIITANDYLAGRDAELMAPIYRYCGLTVGCVTQEKDPDERKSAYNAGITYSTSKEVAADFLRDRLRCAGSKGLPALVLQKMVDDQQDPIQRLVQRGLEYAIVDEADSVFIDEASTPLLISGEGPNQEQIDAYQQAARLAARLNPEADFRVAHDQASVNLTPSGKKRLAELAESLGGLWTGVRRREELVLKALVANTFYLRNKQYIIDSHKIVIVDEYTGRLMPDRTWRDGLHQAIEAKEGIPINLPKETFARISFQRFFGLYRKLSGMSGTVSEARTEIWGTYRLSVIPIPTHRPCNRTVAPDKIFTTSAAKWQAIISEIINVHRTGRPILVGTGSIKDSEHLSRQLTSRGIEHRLLNAVSHAFEAEIVSVAGWKGHITVSTNMAGRGTDIKLGPGVAELGGLHVIATERFSARRVDRQLEGRCARQGDPGSTRVFVSLEDELIQKDTRHMTLVFQRLYSRKDKELISFFWKRWVETIQKKAERLSILLRRDVMSTDYWLDQHLGFTVNEI